MDPKKPRRNCMDYSAGKPVDSRVINEMLPYLSTH